MSVSKKKIYLWNMAGSLCNALASIVFLSIVIRTLGEKQQDIFSFSFSIAQMMTTIGTFQMRVFQSTDIREQFSFSDYFVFRILTTIVMVISSILYIAINGYTDEKAIVMLLLCIYRVTSSFSDLYEGLFQQKERLDLSGKLLSTETVASMVVFAVVLMLSKSLILGCISMIVVSTIILVLMGVKRSKSFVNLSINEYDFKRAYKVCKDLFIKCLPIFINGFLILMIFNIPKNSIDRAISCGQIPEGYQTYYNIIFMPASTINLMFIFFRPQITQMAIYLAENKTRLMKMTMVKLCFVIGLFTIVTCIGGYFLGVPLLNIIYSKDIAPFKSMMLVLLVGGGFSALSILFDNVLTIIRKQVYSSIAYTLTAVTSLIISDRLVSSYGMSGAVYVFLTSMIVLTLSQLVLNLYNLKKI